MTEAFSYEYPTVEEELNRKVIETLSQIEHRYSTGQNSSRDRQVAYATITECTQGLVDRDITDTIGELLASLEGKVLTVHNKTVLVTDRLTIVVTLDYGKSVIRFTRIMNGESKHTEKDLDPFDAITPVQRYREAIVTLKGKGFVSVA